MTALPEAHARRSSPATSFDLPCIGYKQYDIHRYSPSNLSKPHHKNRNTPCVSPQHRKGARRVPDNAPRTDGPKQHQKGSSREAKPSDTSLDETALRPTRATAARKQDPKVAMLPIRDEEGRICDFVFTAADDTACSYHQLTRDKFVGQRLLELFANTRQTNLFPLFRRVMETGQPLEIRGIRYPHDHLDQTFVINLQASVMGDELHCSWHDADGLSPDHHQETNGDNPSQTYPLTLDRRQAGNPTEEAVTQIRNLEQLAQTLIEAREQEQQDLSRELHDNVAQVLSAATARISLAQDEKIPAWLRKELLDLRNQLKHALEDVRHLARDLRPAILDHLGLQATLEKHAEAFRQRTSIRLEVRIDSAAVGAFDQHHLTHLFRLTQEGLQNIEDHSGADQAWITFTPQEDGLLLQIQDNGCGFSPERVIEAQADGHLGLLGMRERAELLDGNFFLQSEPENGTSIRVYVPPPPPAKRPPELSQ